MGKTDSYEEFRAKLIEERLGDICKLGRNLIACNGGVYNTGDDYRNSYDEFVNTGNITQSEGMCPFENGAMIMYLETGKAKFHFGTAEWREKYGKSEEEVEKEIWEKLKVK